MGVKRFIPRWRWIHSIEASAHIPPYPYPKFIPISRLVEVMNSNAEGTFVYYED